MASTSGTSGDGPPPKKKAEIKKLIHDKVASGEAFDRDFLHKFFDKVFTLMEGVDDNNKVPDEFLCPITKQLMSDPVVTASGQTFDRPAILNRRKLGYRTCPVTEEFIFYDAITPNHLVRGMIKNWCRSHGVPEPVEPLVEILSKDTVTSKKTSEIEKLIQDKIASGGTSGDCLLTKQLMSNPVIIASGQKETELKKRLDELIQSIDDTGFIDDKTVGNLFSTIFALKSERNKIPNEFICPISKKLMSDPVVDTSGQTYDRSALTNRQKLLSSRIYDKAITPNSLVRELILKWCRTHNVPEPAQHRLKVKPTDSEVKFFFEMMNNIPITLNPALMKVAVKELLRLTRELPFFRALYAQYPQVLQNLIKILPPAESDSEIDHQLYEDVIAILLIVSADERTRLAVSVCPLTIPLLLRALKDKKIEIRCNAAATIHHISFLYQQKEVIGKSDVFKLLIELLNEKWSPQATRDAMNAISSLCENKSNVERAVILGAAPIVAEKIKNETFTDELLLMLESFVVHKQACEELERLNYIPVLLSIVRENRSDVTKENAISILCTIFNRNRGVWVELVKKIEPKTAELLLRFLRMGQRMRRLRPMQCWRA